MLLDYGAATWGASREEALHHIREVVAMVVGCLAEAGVPIPISSTVAHPVEHAKARMEQVVVTARVPAS